MRIVPQVLRCFTVILDTSGQQDENERIQKPCSPITVWIAVVLSAPHIRDKRALFPRLHAAADFSLGPFEVAPGCRRPEAKFKESNPPFAAATAAVR
jgi:hypothetical protein